MRAYRIDQSRERRKIIERDGKSPGRMGKKRE